MKKIIGINKLGSKFKVLIFVIFRMFNPVASNKTPPITETSHKSSGVI